MSFTAAIVTAAAIVTVVIWKAITKFCTRLLEQLKLLEHLKQLQTLKETVDLQGHTLQKLTRDADEASVSEVHRSASEGSRREALCQRMLWRL